MYCKNKRLALISGFSSFGFRPSSVLWLLASGLLLFASCLLPFACSLAQSGDAGQAGEFLRYGVGARALGMGRAYVALSEDATAVYWNPAGLAQLDQIFLNAMSTKLYFDSHYEYLAIARPFYGFPSKGSKVSLGFGYVGLHTEGFERRDANNIKIGDLFDDRQLAFMFPVAYDYISPLGRLSFGGRLTIFQHSLAGYSDTGYGFDLGILAHIINPPRWTLIDRLLPIKTLMPWRFGAVLHMPSGETLSKERQDYPSSIRIGVSNSDVLLSILPGRLIFAYEQAKILSTNRATNHIVGGEYQLAFAKDIAIALRGGILLKGAKGGSKCSWGLGISGGHDLFKGLPMLAGIGIDFSQNVYPDDSELSSSNTIFLTFRFSTEKENVTRLTKLSDFKKEDENQLMRTLLNFPRDPRLASVDSALVDTTKARYMDGEGLAVGTGVAEELMLRAESRKDPVLANRYDDFIGGLKRIMKEHEDLLGSKFEETPPPRKETGQGYRWFIINQRRDDNVKDLEKEWREKWKEHAKKWERKRNKLKGPQNVDALRMYLRTLLLVGDTEKVRYEIEDGKGVAKKNKNFTSWDRKYFIALADPNDTDSLKAAIDGRASAIIKVYLKLLFGFRMSDTNMLDEVIRAPEASQFALEFLPPAPLFPDGLLVDDALLIRTCLSVKSGQSDTEDLMEVIYRYPGTSAFVILSEYLKSLRRVSSADAVRGVVDDILNHYRHVLIPTGVVWSFSD